MTALGVHFSLSDAEVDELTSRKTDDERLTFFQENIEEEFFHCRKQDVVETDKAWDAIHRCLTDGALAFNSGYPLGCVILDGRQLYSGEHYIMTLKSSDQVRAASPLLAAITKEGFRAVYQLIGGKGYVGPMNDDDFEYTWGNFEGLREFWQRAAASNRNVLFTADQ